MEPNAPLIFFLGIALLACFLTARLSKQKPPEHQGKDQDHTSTKPIPEIREAQVSEPSATYEKNAKLQPELRPHYKIEEVETKDNLASRANSPKRCFQIQCKESVFYGDEVVFLRRYGTWLSALSRGESEPETAEQSKFVEACAYFRKLSYDEMAIYIKEESIDNEIQFVWFKYLFRLNFEQENPHLIGDITSVDWGFQGAPIRSGDSVFFSR